MGTNYYLEEKAPCPACGRDYERLHIGKSSAGWCFALHVDPEDGINDLPDWEDRWSKPGAKIFDEYGREVSAAEMRGVILARHWDRPSDRSEAFLTSNHAVPGPMGLLRHQVDPRFCLGHGSGTYDLMTGEFS